MRDEVKERVPAVVVTAVVVAWVSALALDRFTHAFTPWGAALDMFHWCWAYARYFTDGAFPPGHLLTDLAFVYHAPPAWWLDGKDDSRAAGREAEGDRRVCNRHPRGAARALRGYRRQTEQRC